MISDQCLFLQPMLSASRLNQFFEFRTWITILHMLDYVGKYLVPYTLKNTKSAAYICCCSLLTNPLPWHRSGWEILQPRKIHIGSIGEATPKQSTSVSYIFIVVVVSRFSLCLIVDRQDLSTNYLLTKLIAAFVNQNYTNWKKILGKKCIFECRIFVVFCD